MAASYVDGMQQEVQDQRAEYRIAQRTCIELGTTEQPLRRGVGDRSEAVCQQTAPELLRPWCLGAQGMAERAKARYYVQQGGRAQHVHGRKQAAQLRHLDVGVFVITHMKPAAIFAPFLTRQLLPTVGRVLAQAGLAGNPPP
ncbi:MAG: hypothetical protein PBU97_03075 [Stenotrophomonas maltophilia]